MTSGGTNEMIERVAVAIWDENQKLKPSGERRFAWNEYEEGRSRNGFRNIARAAIKAMREPTAEMVAAAGSIRDDRADESDVRAAWSEAIDAALKELT